MEHRLSALLQLHLHSQLDTWLQWIGQRPLQEWTRNIQVLGFGATYTRGFMVLCFVLLDLGIKRFNPHLRFGTEANPCGRVGTFQNVWPAYISAFKLFYSLCINTLNFTGQSIAYYFGTIRKHCIV